MGFFGKSFEEKVTEAIGQLKAMNLGVDGLSAAIDGKVVTLLGNTKSKDAKFKVMQAFNEMVETENTINTIRIETPAPVVEPVAVAADVVEVPVEAVEGQGERMYEVVGGDTLGGISKKFYGKAGLYMKIFEANTDILDNPNLIKVGQKLRIPE